MGLHVTILKEVMMLKCNIVLYVYFCEYIIATFDVLCTDQFGLAVTLYIYVQEVTHLNLGWVTDYLDRVPLWSGSVCPG
jgi:hypothetical protein